MASQIIFRSVVLCSLMSMATMLVASCGGSDPQSGGTAPQEPAQPALPLVPAQPAVSLAGLKFWIGEQGPSAPTAFSGPQQQPFICLSALSDLGLPEVDNQDAVGQPVYEGLPGLSALKGYSAQCGIKTRVGYFYFTGSDFKRFDPSTGFSNPPADLQQVEVAGVKQPYVVRVEAGSINRFLYTVAMLAPRAEDLASPQTLDNQAWNQKLVYWMRGGVGVGHQQGKAMWFGGLWGEEKQPMAKLLAQGYAVVSSSGNETGVHYNLRLAEETAVMVKEHFVQTYGQPRYTAAMGISGGAVQQYVLGQNRPQGLFDAGVAIQSYPDMVTQTIYASDCSLLEQYFGDEKRRDAASLWNVWSRHSWIEGLAANDRQSNKLFPAESGSSECIQGWGTAVPGVVNPVFYPLAFQQAAALTGWPANWATQVKWTHWNDLQNIYGTNAQGFAPIPLDNVGVQYGLQALKDAKINIEEFLRINACVGSWKEQEDFVNWAQTSDPFDSRNMRRSADCRTDQGTPAPRRSGDVGAMQQAYLSGQVFTGRRLEMPIIDLRLWREDQLDMHNSRQSFSARARLLAGGGNAANQVIWMTPETSSEGVASRAVQALQVLDDYLTQGQRPQSFQDQCFDAQGKKIAAGKSVWDGVLSEVSAGKKGACASSFDIYSSPRMVAGDSFRGDMFKCVLKPLATALSDGSYGSIAFDASQQQWLQRIFPQGVCDYSKPDMGRPASL